MSVTSENDDSPPGRGSAEYASGTINLTIPDNNSGGIASLIGGVGNHVPIALTVTLSINHTRPSDLEAFVTGPDGTRLQLFNIQGDNDLTGLITDTEGDCVRRQLFVPRVASPGKVTKGNLGIRGATGVAFVGAGRRSLNLTADHGRRREGISRLPLLEGHRKRLRRFR